VFFMFLLFALLGDMCFSAVIAYLLGRNRRIVSMAMHPDSVSAGVTFTIIFSLLSIISSYYGTNIGGALASTRIVGTLMGGIIGGPYVGLSVGIVSALHRYSLGGFTASSCAAATLLAGILAGQVRHHIGFHRLNWKIAALTALSAELIQKGFTLAFSQPFEAALAFEKIAALPTIFVSVAGTSLFVLILKDMQLQAELTGARSAQLSLSIADQTLTWLRNGLDSASAQKAAEIVYQLTQADAVAITDRQNILAFVGLGSDHHRTGSAILSDITQQALKTKKPVIFRDGPYCSQVRCPLACGVVAPLIIKQEAVGTLKLYKTRNNGLSVMESQMVEGLARLLASQLALAELERQQVLREQADLKALQAQINPHFLFNTLSIIMSFCRTSPETARELLVNLSDMLHFSFAKHEAKITVAEELASVRAYLEIAKARFGARLQVYTTLDPKALSCLIPAFSIQPLVENALSHGLFPKPADCRLEVSVQAAENQLMICIRDNGIGMCEEKCRALLNGESNGIGVANVYQRLAVLYPRRSEFLLESKEHTGTSITIKIPWERRMSP
jgi:two-component system, LytTR family, sensor histidine kinase LytS